MLHEPKGILLAGQQRKSNISKTESRIERREYNWFNSTWALMMLVTLQKTISTLPGSILIQKAQVFQSTVFNTYQRFSHCAKPKFGQGQNQGMAKFCQRKMCECDHTNIYCYAYDMWVLYDRTIIFFTLEYSIQYGS